MAGAVTVDRRFHPLKLLQEFPVHHAPLLGKSFALKLDAKFMQFGYNFTGTGSQSNNRDGNPMTKDVGGATDRYIGGAATFAVLY